MPTSTSDADSARGGADRAARRARVAVAAVFLTNGALYANLVPRFPQLKADLGLSNTELGAAVAAFPLGSLVAGLLASAVITRLRSGPVAAHGIVLLALAFLLAGIAPTGLLLAVGLDARGDACADTWAARHVGLAVDSRLLVAALRLRGA